MIQSPLKLSLIYTLLALSLRSRVTACGQHDEHNPLERTHRGLRESHKDLSGIIDNGFGPGADRGRDGLEEGNGWFYMNGRNWTSETQFVRGGGRCQTQRLSAEARAQHDADLKNFRSSIDKDDSLRRRLQSTTNTVNINWVVISTTSGVGRLTRTMINNQMTVLNKAFWPQFRFVVKVRRVTDDSFFTCTFDNEMAIKTAYRVANATTLNMYTCYSPGYLGWAYYPSGGTAGALHDGIIVAHNSVPGGNLGVYSYGHVSLVVLNPCDSKLVKPHIPRNNCHSVALHECA
jgi:hypothetical protein